MLSKHQAGDLINQKRLDRGITWENIAHLIDKPLVWTVAAILGQHSLTAQQAALVLDYIGLEKDTELYSDLHAAVQRIPYRGGNDSLSSDPTIYRFYEALGMYGPALKELIHEAAGDGIMSAVDFKIDFAVVDGNQTPGEKRVHVVFNGKFLPYHWQ